MKHYRLFTYIYVPHVIALLLTLFMVGGWALRGARHEHYSQTRESLQAAAWMMADTLQRLPAVRSMETADALCKDMGRAVGYRFTLVLNSGKVIGDSHEDPRNMDHHLGRPEIRQLLGAPLDAAGWSERRSDTIRMNMMYVAVPWHDGEDRIGFIRAARPMGAIDMALVRQRVRMIYAGLWLAVLGLIASGLLAARLSGPLIRMRRMIEEYSAGRSGLRLPSSPVLEIDALVHAMNTMAGQLNDRIRTIVRQRDEQKALLSCMTEAVIAVDDKGVILSMNPAASRVFTVRSEPCVGRPIQEAVRNPDLQRIWRRAMEQEGTVEATFSIPDNNRTLQANATAMTGEQGRCIGCVIVMTDITRLRQLETMRRDFVANVSHELKTPVTSISGFADTLLDGAAEQPEERHRFLLIIQRQARRLASILEDLLALSRLEHVTQQAEIAMQTTRLVPLLHHAAKACHDGAGIKGMTLSVEGDPELTAEVNAPLIEQALINLVGNAVKYGLENTRITISAERQGPEILLRVSDEGPGIARHHVPRLFERFYRVDKGRSRDMGGTGLGLAIVKSIATAHGGRVEVQSAPGKGSVFTILLCADPGPCQGPG